MAAFLSNYSHLKESDTLLIYSIELGLAIKFWNSFTDI